jgi:hypothetical protein
MTYGACVDQFRAVAKTTDDTEVVRQLADPSTTVAAVAAEGQALQQWGCKSPCSSFDLPPQLPPGCPP